MSNLGVISLLRSGATTAARGVIGWEIVHTTDEGSTGGIIVETEAYMSGDPASHAFRGMTRRNQPMFGSAGSVYVYFTYGMHTMLNIVTGEQGTPEAVLIRALRPTIGLDLMSVRRSGVRERDLCRGPGRLAQALGIQLGMSGSALEPGALELRPTSIKPVVVASSRIGIKQGLEFDWRFYEAGSPYVSGLRVR